MTKKKKFYICSKARNGISGKFCILPGTEPVHHPTALSRFRFAKEVVRQYRKPLEDLNLTYTQYLVMMVLWEFGGMTEGEALKEKAQAVPAAMQKGKRHMKAAVRYYTQTGNTKKLADAIAAELGVEAKSIQAVKAFARGVVA